MRQTPCPHNPYFIRTLIQFYFSLLVIKLVGNNSRRMLHVVLILFLCPVTNFKLDMWQRLRKLQTNLVNSHSRIISIRCPKYSLVDES